MKAIAKTESFAEFIARGGKVTKCPTKDATKKYSTPRANKEPPVEMSPAEMALIPMALVIALGIKQ